MVFTDPVSLWSYLWYSGTQDRKHGSRSGFPPEQPAEKWTSLDATKNTVFVFADCYPESRASPTLFVFTITEFFCFRTEEIFFLLFFRR